MAVSSRKIRRISKAAMRRNWRYRRFFIRVTWVEHYPRSTMKLFNDWAALVHGDQPENAVVNLSPMLAEQP